MSKVPEEELFLAKIIQNAAARGLSAITGDLYADDCGRGRGHYEEGSTAGCCAVGAARLEYDTHGGDGGSRNSGLVSGNDGMSDAGENSNWYTVGMCFQDALGGK
jgi:hypothetical protein